MACRTLFEKIWSEHEITVLAGGVSLRPDVLAGSIGMVPSVSMSAPGPDGHRRALYEPIHGSAPDIAGQGIANPLGAILSFALCLRYTLTLPQEAERLEKAVERVVAGGVRTRESGSAWCGKRRSQRSDAAPR